MRRCRLAIFAIMALFATLGCAQKLTPQQEHAYKAIDSCKDKGGQQDWSYWVLPNGSIRFDGRADGFQGVKQCLEQRFGYRF